MTTLSRVLIANRGEIVARVARSCHDYGLSTVAVFSDADRGAPFVFTCDRAFAIGGTESRECYLDIEAIISAARATDCDAIHPGYGFLSENPRLAEACEAAGLVFIGPPANVLAELGDKATAKAIARAAEVPVVPGYEGDDQSEAALSAAAAELGLPVLLKASSGGGGKGMRIIRDTSVLADGIAGAKREAEAAFGDPRLIVERYIERPRHIELQILADHLGRVIHLGERECSIQRRHQKIIEEAPSPAIDEATRRKMGDAAVALAEKVGYRSAGTVEFILDEDGRFYFLEVNARLQVEHGVTELITGIDIVREQLRIAEGKALTLDSTPALNGHAIEARLYAEDPSRGFLPQPGTLLDWQPPASPHLRIDAALAPGAAVPPHYDPMIAKLIAHGDDRQQAIDRLRRALTELWCPGIVTNQGLLSKIIGDADFVAGELSTHFLDERSADLLPADDDPEGEDLAAIAAVLAARQERSASRSILPNLPFGFSNNPLGRATVELDVAGKPVEIAYQPMRDGSLELSVGESNYVVVDHRSDGGWLELELGDGRAFKLRIARDGERTFVRAPCAPICVREEPRFSVGMTSRDPGLISAPMPGKVIEILVLAGDRVEAGDTIAILEAMKMEHRLVAEVSGIVTDIVVTGGDQVGSGQRIAAITAE